MAAQRQPVASGLCQCCNGGRGEKGLSYIQCNIALTQADTVLAKLVVDGHADAILGNDGDFPVLICGKGVAITNFNVNLLFRVPGLFQVY